MLNFGAIFSPQFMFLAATPLCILLTGCSATSDRSVLLDRTLDIVGLQRSTPQEATLDNVYGAASKTLPPSTRKITFRLHAGNSLNVDMNGRSLSVVAKIYKLRDKEAFERATYEDFPISEKASAFTPDIIEVREIILTPGKAYETVEPMSPGASYFAVVALFRAPAERRWRFIFDTNSAAKSGVTLGVHACAMSVSAGDALGASPEMLRVAGVRCPAP